MQINFNLMSEHAINSMVDEILERAIETGNKVEEVMGAKPKALKDTENLIALIRYYQKVIKQKEES